MVKHVIVLATRQSRVKSKETMHGNSYPELVAIETDQFTRVLGNELADVLPFDKQGHAREPRSLL